jgi:hypothetical protein
MGNSDPTLAVIGGSAKQLTVKRVKTEVRRPTSLHRRRDPETTRPKASSAAPRGRARNSVDYSLNPANGNKADMRIKARLDSSPQGARPCPGKFNRC